MSRPSEPLLAWLREKADERGMNTAALATRAELTRSRVRKLLTGKEPMFVDELLKISQALELSPADMGVPEIPEAELPEGTTAEDAKSTLEVVDEDDGPQVDPYANHHRQLLEVAFALGCDFAITAYPEELTDSGVPRHVLDAHLGRLMLIQLDAAYHSYNNPRYDDGGITLTLSFDSLYDVRFPWSAIHQVIMTPAPWEEEDDEDLDEDDEPSEDGPRLRLVT